MNDVNQMNQADDLMRNYTVELVVFNRHGVLNRVANVYSRRGYNIDSLHVDADKARSPGVSRMVIASQGDEYAQTQVIRQLSKLYDVMEVKLLADAQ